MVLSGLQVGTWVWGSTAREVAVELWERECEAECVMFEWWWPCNVPECDGCNSVTGFTSIRYMVWKDDEDEPYWFCHECLRIILDADGKESNDLSDPLTRSTTISSTRIHPGA